MATIPPIDPDESNTGAPSELPPMPDDIDDPAPSDAPGDGGMGFEIPPPD